MDKQKQIQTFINDIEDRYQINIILAIESGSRAWGFPSKDSDYDIRCLYHHPESWYLSAFKKTNVIENIFMDDLDLAGWDITKCLQLLYKGNTPIYEWLYSPIVYRQDEVKLNRLKNLAVKAFNPKVIFYHYTSLAKKKLLDVNSQTNAKAFLYGLRALLSAQWVYDETTIPPVEFDRLHKRYISDSLINEQLIELLTTKASLLESDNKPIHQNLLDYATRMLSALENVDIPASRMKVIDVYDSVLIDILRSDIE